MSQRRSRVGSMGVGRLRLGRTDPCPAAGRDWISLSPSCPFRSMCPTEPPVRILCPQERSLELRALALQRLELRCELSRADAQVCWFKDGLEVDETENLLLQAEGPQRWLIVLQAQAEDAGEYICETKDESVSFDIRVSGEHGGPGKWGTAQTTGCSVKWEGTVFNSGSRKCCCILDTTHVTCGTPCHTISLRPRGQWDSESSSVLMGSGNILFHELL
uniref:Ig-like domain-containing protein n=1 Tax=Chelonoidis abingdonii TaxID=106734 RepID=A0A8C0HC99_CHEAB